jgi:hypothetical protein
VLGAVGKQHMELLSYQPTTHHGHAVALFHPGEKPDADPPLAAYKLNKLLYDLRFKPSLRLRAFQDVAPIAAEYGLSKEHTAALQETFAFRHIGGDKPGQDADPLAAVGAHPIGALMAVHTLQQEKRKLGAAVPHLNESIPSPSRGAMQVLRK